MIINIKEGTYVSQPYIVPELMVYYNGRKLDTIILNIDRKSLKIESVPLYDITCSVFDEKYIKENRSYYPTDQNTTSPSGMHMMSDENYLYIWTGKKWKRTMLLDFDTD